MMMWKSTASAPMTSASRPFLVLIALAACGPVSVPIVSAGGLPTTIGQCSETSITEVGTRLLNAPGSGSAVSFANGGYQVSYEQEWPVDQSRVGDPVRMCLIHIPEGCPPGDDRGRVYTTTNLRTGAAWTMADASHICGGA